MPRGKAQTIASASGLHIRRIIGVTEASAAPPLPLADTGRVSAPTTPIEPGTQLVQATVTRYVLGGVVIAPSLARGDERGVLGEHAVL